MIVTQFFVIRNNQITAERLEAAKIEAEMALIKQKTEEYRIMVETKKAVDARKAEAKLIMDKLAAEKRLAKAEAKAKKEAEAAKKLEKEQQLAENKKQVTNEQKVVEKKTEPKPKPKVEENKPVAANCDVMGERDALICLTNNARLAANLKPLKVVASMNDYALVRAQEIIEHFAHERPDGSSIGDQYGENLANGYSTAVGAFNGFWNSPGHKKNLLNPRYQTIGVGFTTDENGRGYWAMLFTY